VPGTGRLKALLDGWRSLPGLERVPGPRAALTFDDGPDPEGTPAVLEALDAEDVRATFFLVGEQLMRAPRLGREIRERGHEVALGGFLHAPHASLHPGQARDDLARALGAIEAATAVRPRWCRPPYGLFSEASYAACADLGLEPAYWSAWGLDWEPLAPARIAELVAEDLEPGAVVVLHDSARYSARPSAAPTAAAVRLVGRAARERGVELGTLGEAAGPPAG
jgi:peptidoglycan/xylan/chitin deacetylase (PgdA/CDA1 family)